jgi:hypothetical protein
MRLCFFFIYVYSVFVSVILHFVLINRFKIAVTIKLLFANIFIHFKYENNIKKKKNCDKKKNIIICKRKLKQYFAYFKREKKSGLSYANKKINYLLKF